MRRGVWTLLVCAIGGHAIGALSPARAEETYWQQDVQYTIHTALDTAAHTLAGEETLVYRNNSPDTLDVLWLHLYPDAFRDNSSHFMRDALQRYDFVLVGLRKENRGYVEIPRCRVDGADIPYEIDDTLMRIRLPRPLPPGGELVLDCAFLWHIPEHYGRAGYRGAHYDIAQWYPKPVVYDEKGWHPDQFRASGEFYGEYGTFDVTITLPAGYVVASTGVCVEGDPGWEEARKRAREEEDREEAPADTTTPPSPVAGAADTTRQAGPSPAGAGAAEAALSEAAAAGADTSQAPARAAAIDTTGGPAPAGTAEAPATKTVRFHAERVHDFAWCADPTYALQDTMIALQDTTMDSVRVMSFFRSFQKDWKDSTLIHGVRAIRWLSDRFGPYPYPQVSVVDALLGGGMEYPMLVMDGDVSEGLVLHEVGHIYFYAIFGNNEMDEAWLDEGFTTFQTRWYMETTYGPHGKTQDWSWYDRLVPHMSQREANDHGLLELARDGYWEPVSLPAYAFRHSYASMVYGKGSKFYEMLRYVVGEETFQRICHEYFRRWALKHVNEERFRQVCEEVSGQDLGWLFEEWLHTTKTCDYALADVRGEWVAQDGARRYRTDVAVERKGPIVMPVEVHLEIEEEPDVVQRIDGGPGRQEATLWSESRPTAVSLNPANEILDINMLNNRRPLRVEMIPEYPRMWFSPEDRYLVTYRPSAWFNDLDGVKVGARLKGRHAEDFWRTDLGLWYGTRSEEVDFRASLAHSLRFLGRYNTVLVRATRLEGRQEGLVALYKTFRPLLSRPRAHNVWLAASHTRLFDPSYVLPGEWEPGAVNKIAAGYRIEPRGDALSLQFQVEVETAQEAFGSDHTFTTVSGEAVVRTELRLPVNVRGRLFAASSSSRTPAQERLWLADGGPLAKFQRFFLRSRGGLPEDVNYHLGGGGNLRGYLEGNRGVTDLVSTNWEALAPLRLPLAGRLLRPLWGSPQAALFLDGGSVLGEGVPEELDGFLYDLGVGVRIRRELKVTDLNLRFDFPFFVSRPALNAEEERLDFRWLASLAGAF